MSDPTPLTAALDAAARALGERLPAAYDLVPAGVQVGEAVDHPMPEAAAAVRWPLEGGGALVVAVPAAAADLLRERTADGSLATALTARIDAALPHLAPLFGGTAPGVGAGEEVAAAAALAGGPGEPMSVVLDDAGSHRATLALRAEVDAALLAAAAAPAAPAAAAAPQLPADVAAAGPPLHAVPAEAPGALPAGYGHPAAAGYGAPPPGHGPARRRGWREADVLPPGGAAPAEFATFDQVSAFPGVPHGMHMLGDVEMGVTAELGRTKLTVRDVLGLNQGSIIELDRAAGSPVDVVVNGTLIARGEVVVIDEEFGIRITEIIGMDDERAGAHHPDLPVAQ
jgi:flagellar motor switch protein FliN